MKRLLQYLNSNKWVTVLILFVYFLMVVLPHELVGKVIVAMFSHTTRAVYQNTILIIGLVISGTLLFFLLRNLIRNKLPNTLYLYLMVTIVLMILAFKLLIIHNVEMIHFAQYFVFAALVLVIVQSPAKAFFWSTLAGTVDEMYQYFYLAPKNTDYFDFNDIVLNQLGAALGLIFVLSISLKLSRNRKFKAEIFTLAGIVLSLGILSFLNILSVYPSDFDPQPAFILVKKIDPGFWTIIQHLNVKYHTIKPFEGVVLVFALMLFYSFLDYLPKKKTE